MPDDTKNQPGAAAPGQPADGKQPVSDAANEQGQQPTSGWKAAEQYKSEAAQLRKELEAFKAQQKKAEDERLAKQGEYQTLAEQRAQALAQREQELRNERVQNALIAAASRAGAVDPEDLVALSKLDGVDVSDRAALRQAAEAAVAELQKSKPYLFGKPGKNGTPFETPQGIPGGTKPVDLSKVSAGDVAKLTPEQKRALAGQHGYTGPVDFWGRPLKG